MNNTLSFFLVGKKTHIEDCCKNVIEFQGGSGLCSLHIENIIIESNHLIDESLHGFQINGERGKKTHLLREKGEKIMSYHLLLVDTSAKKHLKKTHQIEWPFFLPNFSV